MVVCPRVLPLEFQRSLSVLAAETEESVRSQVAETRNGTLRKPSRSRIASRRGHGPTGTLLGALYAKPLGFETCWSSRSRRPPPAPARASWHAASGGSSSEDTAPLSRAFRALGHQWNTPLRPASPHELLLHDQGLRPGPCRKLDGDRHVRPLHRAVLVCFLAFRALGHQWNVPLRLRAPANFCSSSR
jgi:hypothetical protein